MYAIRSYYESDKFDIIPDYECTTSEILYLDRITSYNVCYTKLLRIELVTGPEPVSHTLTTWIALHGRVKDNSCKACHTTPEGIDDLATLEGKPPVDDSFCGNESYNFV